MPQMMPINWMISLIFFICIYILFNIMNYYIYLNKYNTPKMNNKNNKNIKMNWKW
uniref:ATP synthase complex subunit 8 n=1 Tax=Protambulyx ockendeni TaxID=1088144 RepID=A0A6G6D876_9NEOP|nr:ATP synthase F0 subunit 8 [Protambulyx ockendeni]QIE12722.1 ATP synthase F0 subunit 8 [Protambulyx ockendeni]